MLLNVNILEQGKFSTDTTLQIDRLDRTFIHVPSFDGSHDAVKANAPVVDVEKRKRVYNQSNISNQD